MAKTLVFSVNETIRLLLTRTGRGQADLAERLNVSPASVSHRLTGRYGWKLSDMEPVADFFGLTPCELLSGYSAIEQADRLPPAR
jgi:transcriptional regulator with XRE-family HTH domain